LRFYRLVAFRLFAFRLDLRFRFLGFDPVINFVYEIGIKVFSALRLT
jgi:hypothetical protein